MATPALKLTRQRSVTLLPAILLLARKLFQQTWGLLLVILCGMVVSVGLVCAVPLFSQVTLKIGLQRMISQTPGGPIITATMYTDQPTPALIDRTSQRLDRDVRQSLTNYLAGNAQVTLATPQLQLLENGTGRALPQEYMNIYGYEPSQFSQQVTVLQGRLPQTSSNQEIEVAITQAVANKLGLTLGTTRQVRFPIAAGSTVWNVHIVGIMAVRSTVGNFWHIISATPDNQDGVDGAMNTNYVLASLPALKSQAAAIQISQPNPTPGQVIQPTAQMEGATFRSSTSTSRSHMTVARPETLPLRFNAATSGGGGLNGIDPLFRVYLVYPIAVSHLDANNLKDILQPYRTLSSQNSIQDPHILSLEVLSPAMDQLDKYRSFIPFEQVVVILLLLSILGLALFMVSLLANILVERQLNTIVVLRSRGATQRHIFGAFAWQGLVLGLVALVAGPAFAVLVVSLIGQMLLKTTVANTFMAVTSNLPGTLRQELLLALITVVIALIVMLASLRRASQIDIVTLRRINSRSNQVPLWKRLYLDLLVLGLFGAGIVYYQLLTQSSVSTNITLAPLALLGAPILVLATSLLCLRIFPWLIHLGTRLMSGSKGAPGLLAFAQLERQPKATLRLILLLALALATGMYVSSFIATQEARIQEVAAYQVGADLSGTIVVSNPKQSLKDLQAHYSSTPGARSATLGYQDTTEGNSSFGTISILAVDSDTYARTSSLSSAYSDQSLKSLTDQLIAQRDTAIKNNEIPIVANANLWNDLGLRPGAKFTLSTKNLHFQNLTFVALAQTSNPLRVHDSRSRAINDHMFLDYQTYAGVYSHKNQGSQIQPNYLWLATGNDARSLAAVRQSFPGFQDRRALVDQGETSPLKIAIQGTFVLSLIVALAIALIGVGLTAWLSVKQRLMGFSILRALGMTPSQISHILFLEQGITFLFALIIGLLIGWLLTLLVAPSFVIVNYLQESVSSGGTTDLPIQKSAPIPLEWIGLMLLIFMVICVFVFLLMSRSGARTTFGKTLRLNED